MALLREHLSGRLPRAQALEILAGLQVVPALVELAALRAANNQRHRSFAYGHLPVNLVGAHQGKATPESFFGKLVSDFGANRIAWGSNYPASEKSLPDLVKLAQETLSFLPARDREWIFSGTAETLYPALREK